MGRRGRSFEENGAQGAEIDHEPCRAIIAGLEADVRHLKTQLADRGRDPVETGGRRIRRAPRDDDWLTDLPDQDRRFMERKLGIKR